MTITISLLVGLSLLSASLSFAPRWGVAERVLALGGDQRGRASSSRWLDLLGQLGRVRPRTSARGEVLRGRLRLAGDPISVEALRGVKLAAAIGIAGVAVLAAPVAPMAALLSPPMSFAAFRIPDLLVGRLARRRQSRLEGQVPDLVELLVAVSQAGLSPLVALRRAAEAMAEPLGTELRTAALQIDLGAPWREALDELVARTEAPSLRRLAAALTRSGRLGTSVSSTLRSVADDLRAHRRTRAEELARRAPVKMLFPLVFLILPAFLLLTVGPVVLATIRSLR